MKKIFYPLAALLLLASCKTSKENKHDEANNKKIINVIINPIIDSSFYFTKGNRGIEYSNEKYYQYLVKQLGDKNNKLYQAKFFTQWESEKDNVHPDWVVKITLVSLDMPKPKVSIYSKTKNSSVVPFAEDVTTRAKLTTDYKNISYSVSGQLVVNITDVKTGKKISSATYSDTYTWVDQDVSSSTGDLDGLGGNRGNLSSNNNPIPNKEFILNNLYQKLYPKIKSSIANAVNM